MPLPVAAQALSTHASGLTTLAKWGGSLALVLGLRNWASGYRCPDLDDGELAGKTYILTGGFSSTGIAVFARLAAAGAQVIALHPSPLSPSVVQILLLLRSSSSNERLYAEECDLSDLASVRMFVQRWQKDARAGMVQDLEARVDGILFCDGGGDGLGGVEGLPYDVGAEYVDQPAGEGRTERYHQAKLVGPHALVQLLLPVLLRSVATSTTPIRIINCVNPFYAAVPPAPDALDPTRLDYPAGRGKGRVYPRKAPWVAMGRVGAASVLLWSEFSRRLSSTSASSAPAPPPADLPAGAAPPSSSAPILALSVCPGLTRSSLLSLLRASPSSPHFSYLGLLLYFAFFPLIRVFAKSADEAAQGVVGALTGDIEGKERKKRTARGAGGAKEGEGEKRAAVQEEEEARRMVVRGGALYREGKEVRVPLFAHLSPSAACDLWDSECKLVERVLGAVVKEEKEREKAGGKKEEGRPEEGRPEEGRKDV
ncbi:hypothetical protein JCM8097_008455 [Rhodosporidiobolus ruineniae]